MGMGECGGICELLFKLLCKLPKVGVGALLFAPIYISLVVGHWSLFDLVPRQLAALERLRSKGRPAGGTSAGAAAPVSSRSRSGRRV